MATSEDIGQQVQYPIMETSGHEDETSEGGGG